MHAAADRFLLQVEALLAGGEAQDEEAPPIAHKGQPPTVRQPPPDTWSAALPAGLPAAPTAAPVCMPPLWSHVAASLAPTMDAGMVDMPMVNLPSERAMAPQLPIAGLHCGEMDDSKPTSLQTLLVSLMAQRGAP